MAIPQKITQYREIIDKWCTQIGVSQSLVMAVIQMESGGNPNAKRPEPGYMRAYVEKNPKWLKFSRETGITLQEIATSYGLLQMMFATAHGYGCKTVAQALDPSQAIRFGVAHLKTLLDKYPIGEALAAYNGGDGGASQYRTGKDTPATRYAKNVLALFERYKAEISVATPSTPTQKPIQSGFFKREEFTCKCGCGTNKTVSKLVETLDVIRAKVGVPVTVISGTRCPKHNASVGGVANSAHTTGEAADIQAKGYDAKRLIDAIDVLYKAGRLPYLRYCYNPGGNSAHVGVDDKKRNPVIKKPS